jgi:hypothetical protein
MTGERVVDGREQHLLPTYWSKSSRRPLFAQPMRRMPAVVWDLGQLVFAILLNRLPTACRIAGPPNLCVLMRYDVAGDHHINPHQDGLAEGVAKSILPDSAVITVTLSGSQEFRVHNMRGEVVAALELQADSIFLLHPDTDKNYKHSTANVRGSSDRDALIYRWSRTHEYFNADFPHFYADPDRTPASY